MSLYYRVKGLDRFLRQVADKPREAREAVDRELAKSTLRIELKAKTNAPWDTGWLSGNIYSDKVGNLRFQVVSPVNYSVYVELGTRYMAAQPYLQPALTDEYPVLMANLNYLFRR